MFSTLSLALVRAADPSRLDWLNKDGESLLSKLVSTWLVYSETGRHAPLNRFPIQWNLNTTIPLYGAVFATEDPKM